MQLAHRFNFERHQMISRVPKRPISRDKALCIQNLNVVRILSLIKSASPMAHYEPSDTFKFRDFSIEQYINIIGEKNLLLSKSGKMLLH